MMPLWTTTIWPVQSRCGCAFSSVGRPCVAQRVWPMPYSPVERVAARSTASRFDELAGAAAELDPPVAHDGDAGRVVAAVLEPAQPVDEDRDDLLWADVADDSAHDV